MASNRNCFWRCCIPKGRRPLSKHPNLSIDASRHISPCWRGNRRPLSDGDTPCVCTTACSHSPVRSSIHRSRAFVQTQHDPAVEGTYIPGVVLAMSLGQDNSLRNESLLPFSAQERTRQRRPNTQPQSPHLLADRRRLSSRIGVDSLGASVCTEGWAPGQPRLASAQRPELLPAQWPHIRLGAVMTSQFSASRRVYPWRGQGLESARCSRITDGSGVLVAAMSAASVGVYLAVRSAAGCSWRPTVFIPYTDPSARATTRLAAPIHAVLPLRIHSSPSLARLHDSSPSRIQPVWDQHRRRPKAAGHTAAGTA